MITDGVYLQIENVSDYSIELMKNIFDKNSLLYSEKAFHPITRENF
jgi:hypothetical protein